MRFVLAALALCAAASAAHAQTPGFLQCAQSRPEQAIPICTDLLQKTPASAAAVRATIFSARGNAYLAQQQLDPAFADFTEALKLDPTLAHSYNGLGAIYRLRGDYDKAIAQYDQAIRLQKNRSAQATYYQNRANAYRWKGDFDKAIADFTSAVEINPQHAYAFANRGWAYRMKRDFGRALSDFDAAIRISPNVALFYAERGATQESSNNLQNALDDFRKAQQLAPGEKFIRAIQRLEQRIQDRTDITQPGKPETRIALVIGNSRYANVPPLTNPRNDAEAVANALGQVGFSEVILKQDLSREETLDALRSFAKRADRADWAVVYFAGHGMEVNGVNYVLPVDARIAANRNVTDEAVALDNVLQAVEGARKLRFIILDACRDNPFRKSQGAAASRSSVLIGLSHVEPEGATLVAYAAKHGQTALDGSGNNSPFVSALVKHLRTPGLEINLMLRKVRDDVLATTARKQEPFTYGSLPSEPFYFAAR